MSGAELYFRVRDGGAQVFRVDTDGKDGRMRLDPLAHINVKAGDVRVQGDRSLTDADRERIESWITSRRAALDAREMTDLQRTIEAMQAAAHWLNGKADDAKVRDIEDDLLMAAHDLRLAIVKRKTGR